ncbi:MAG: hypothetical protein WC966_11270, partial [Bradymonadales bacterium]
LASIFTNCNFSRNLYGKNIFCEGYTLIPGAFEELSAQHSYRPRAKRSQPGWLWQKRKQNGAAFL